MSDIRERRRRFSSMARRLRAAADYLESVGRQPSEPNGRIREARLCVGTAMGDLDLALRDGTIDQLMQPAEQTAVPKCELCRDTGWEIVGAPGRKRRQPCSWVGHGHLEPAESPKTIDELIEASSLGTPEAKAIRTGADPALVQRVLDRADELSKQPDCPRCGGEGYEPGTEGKLVRRGCSACRGTGKQEPAEEERGGATTLAMMHEAADDPLRQDRSPEGAARHEARWCTEHTKRRPCPVCADGAGR